LKREAAEKSAAAAAKGAVKLDTKDAKAEPKAEAPRRQRRPNRKK
jgi:hypothetical protein